MVKLLQTVTPMQRRQAKFEALVAIVERYMQAYVTSYELQTLEVDWWDPEEDWDIDDIDYYHDDHVETLESEMSGYYCSLCRREIDDPMDHVEEVHSDKLNEEIKVKLRQLK
jgi:hypothetical protein